MRRRKPIETEHLAAPLRQMVKRGASHRAKTDYDRIEVIGYHSVSSTAPTQEREPRGCKVDLLALVQLDSAFHLITLALTTIDPP
jgi:hypothetical protein